MKILTFAEINDLENGMQIPSLTGKVERMFDQRTGEGQYGIWWLQSFTLIDEHANEITCTWTGEDTVNELQGKTILIESTFNKKEQLVGIKKEIKNKNGKRYESVKLDDRCKIKTLSGETRTGENPIVDSAIGSATRDASPAQHSHPESAASKIDEYIDYSLRVFEKAWNKAAEMMPRLMPDKDAKEMSVEAWYDLQMRITQHASIDTGKIIRKERF